ncbi:MAG: class I SAM-dependent methyltransferase, partial [Candidatus Acidiferrales bacterium]
MSNDLLRDEFNRWAEAGRGEHMEEDHLPIALPMLDRIQIRPEDNILDVGCGAGWLARLLAERVPDGRVVGLDVSDEMIRRARRNLADVENVLFVVGAADEIPWDANFFTHAVSIESAYYWPVPPRGLKEIHRVLAEGGRASILINYYADNPHCHQWSQHFAIPAHLH